MNVTPAAPFATAIGVDEVTIAFWLGQVGGGVVSPGGEQLLGRETVCVALNSLVSPEPHLPSTTLTCTLVAAVPTEKLPLNVKLFDRVYCPVFCSTQPPPVLL